MRARETRKVFNLGVQYVYRSPKESGELRCLPTCAISRGTEWGLPYLYRKSRDCSESGGKSGEKAC